MNKKHRKMLVNLHKYCNMLGGYTDMTATNKLKYKDAQQAHSSVSDVLYGILCDVPENDYRLEDIETAKNALKELEKLTKKNYPDIHGLYEFKIKENGK